MIPRSYIKKIRAIELRTNKLAQDLLTGSYHSVFKGRGMDFEEVREYQPGDDVRSLDWNVTARTGVPHIKKHREERQLTIMVVVDISASDTLGSGEQTKKELAAEIASVLAFSSNRNGDRIGLILHTDQIESFIPPAKGRSHIFRIIREILFFHPASKGTSIKVALDFLNLVQTKPAVAFFVSDFLDEGYEKSMKITARKHDLVAIRISDRLEMELPDAGMILLQDAESGELMEVDTSDKKLREKFAREAREERQLATAGLAKAGLDVIEMETDVAYHLALKKFFERRIRRSRR